MTAVHPDMAMFGKMLRSARGSLPPHTQDLFQNRIAGSPKADRMRVFRGPQTSTTSRLGGWLRPAEAA